jgi:hypothetical protein
VSIRWKVSRLDIATIGWRCLLASVGLPLSHRLDASPPSRL